jgi:hypothetical protein
MTGVGHWERAGPEFGIVMIASRVLVFRGSAAGATWRVGAVVIFVLSGG